MKGFKFKPVAWMTTIVAVLTGLVAVDQTGAVDIIPTAAEPWVAGAIVILTTVLGVITHNRVTPLAAPKDVDGQPLVPASMRRP